jgi:hypothetical protein
MPYTDSASAEGSVDLTGVWLHDPLDPDGTTSYYLYGSANREHSVDSGGQGTLYAGREYQVAEFGEHSRESLSVRIDVPHGSDYATELSALEAYERSKRTLWLRDNRGRSFAGMVVGFKIADEKWGAAVSFTFDRVDSAVEEVEV